jgi:hypothetical protein
LRTTIDKPYSPGRQDALFMNITSFQALACPLDGAPLCCTGATWRCPGGHSFDMASQGYAHLLPVQNKRSRDPGDSRQMVAARRRFLNAGFYQAIATATSEAVLADLPPRGTVSCLDAGCGEGYYLRQLAAASSDGQTLVVAWAGHFEVGGPVGRETGQAAQLGRRQQREPAGAVGNA